MDVAAYAYGAPLHDASVDELLNREVCQWYFHVSHSDRRVLQDDDELSDDDESGEGDDGRDIDIRLSTLLQSVDVDVLRTSFNDPFTAYSANRYSVTSAVRSVADAAATLHVSKLLSRYNARAKKLFEGSVRSYNKRQEEEFKNLFCEIDDTRLPQGYVLLKPVKSKEYEGTIAGYRAVVPTENRQKRVRLSTIASVDGEQVSVPIVPSSTEPLRTEFGVPSNDIGALGCIPDVEYEVVYGNTSTIFDKPRRCTIWSLVAQLRGGTTSPLLLEGIDLRFPFLLGDNFLGQLRETYREDLGGLLPSHVITLLENIQQTCKTRKETFYAQLSNVSAMLTRANNIWEYYFSEWCRKSPLNVPIVFFNRNPGYTLQDMFRSRCFDQNANRRYWNQGNYDKYFELFFGQIENRDNFDCFLTVGDLLRATKEKTFTDTLPSIDDGASAGTPVVITDSYNRLVSEPQSQMKFKLALTKHQGLNPAYFADEGDENPLGVPNSDNHVDFDDDIKRFEFDLHAKDCRGYQEEFKTTCRMLLQVLFTSSSRPDASRMPKGGDFDIFETYQRQHQTEHHDSVQQGFVYVPQYFPRELRANLQFMKNFRLALIPAENYEQIATFPGWNRRERVSAASYYFWKNAMATVASPFSSVPESVKVNNVAAVLALSEPFTSMKRIQQKLIDQLLKAITADELFKDSDCLHLVQLTSGSMAPGITDFCQSFDPLVVHFKGAAIEEVKDANQFKMTYSLGTESTILIEAFMIATALIKILNANHGEESFPPDDKPRSQMKVVRFPFKTDADFKHDKSIQEYNKRDIQYGYATAFSKTGFHKTCIDFESYNKFINYRGLRVENKAGNVSWGKNPKPKVAFNILNGPGLIVPGNYVGNREINHFMDNEPFTNFGRRKVRIDSAEEIQQARANALEGEEPNLFKSIYYNSNPMFQFRYALTDKKLSTYEDYIAHSIFKSTDQPEIIAFPGEHYSKLSVPMYANGRLCAYCTIEFIRVENNYHVDRNNENVRVELNDDLQFNITSIFIVDYQHFVLDGRTLRSRDSDLHLGFLLSREYTDTQTNRIPEADKMHFMRQNQLFFRIKTFRRRRQGLRGQDPGDSILRFGEDELQTVETNKLSYFRFEPQSSFIKYEKKNTPILDKQEIVKLIKDGCQGYHFSRRDALSRTVFAVAINDTKKQIQEWYQACDGTLPGDLGKEHRGIHIIKPDRHHQNCAKLLNLILRHEMKGSATLGQMATTGKHLITPVIVNVLGPMESSLLTPCYVDNVFAKTARFRSVEAQIIGMIESHLDMIRRVDVVKGRVRNCLAEHIMRHKPRSIESCKWMIDKKSSVIPTMATLFIRVTTYNEISAKTSQGRATTSVAIAYKEIEATLHNLLFKM